VPVTKPFFVLFLLGVCGCGGASASKLAQPPEYAPKGETKCSVMKSQSSPLIVEWPSAERAKLESLAKNGLIAVRYTGCEMETLGACRVNAKYRYSALTPKHDQLRIKNADELYATMPVHAVSFEGKLQEAGELDVTMTIVGRYEAEQPNIDAESMQGDCARATHVVTAITAGAFRFYAGADAATGGGVSILGAGAGAKSSASRNTLAQDGDEQACSAAGASDTAPPFGCGALLRLEVAPIAPHTARAAEHATASPSPPTKQKPKQKPAPASAPAALPASSHYSIAGETVIDSRSQLTWQRSPEASRMTWSDAKAFCDGLSLAHGGWRLPSKDELLSIGENLPAGIDRDAFPPAVDKEKDKVTAAVVFYWSSTPHPVSESMAWGVRYATMGAQAVLQSRSSRHLVRCVNS
jgi:Protein of unknown function (DUF1566)